jgi:hypothetical protein
MSETQKTYRVRVLLIGDKTTRYLGPGRRVLRKADASTFTKDEADYFVNELTKHHSDAIAKCWSIFS